MTITFSCEHCRKEVKAPDSAAGKRGKCPYCGQSNYVPAPVDENDILPLAPVDEDEERRRQQELRELRQQEHDIIAEIGGLAGPPLEEREDLTPEDLYHFVVNYCIDMLDSKLDRARMQLAQMKKFPAMSRQAVADFMSGKASEPVLEHVPQRVLTGFLAQLRDELK